MTEIHLDDRGRVYLPKEVRERYGRRYRLVELRSGIQLVPVPDDPVLDLQEALAPLKDVPVEELREAARRNALREALDDRR